MFSPYAAMGNAPESMVDPNGTFAGPASFSGMGNPMLGDIFGGDGFRSLGGFKLDGSKAGGGGPSGGAGGGSGSGGGGGGNTGANGDVVTYTGEQAAVAFLIVTGQIPLVKGLGSATTPVPLSEVTITPNPYGELNVMQAAAQDIGRNDYNRWKVDNFSKIVVGWTAAPFVIAAAAELGPLAFTSFLSNPSAWIEGGGSLIMGAAGYDGHLPSAGALKGGGKVIGLGLDADLALERGTGAITYKAAGWQQAGLTKVDWGRASIDNFHFKQSFQEAAENAGAIRFNVSSFNLAYPKPGITNFEFNHIINNQSLLQKTTFIQNGSQVFWNGKDFIK